MVKKKSKKKTKKIVKKKKAKIQKKDLMFAGAQRMMGKTSSPQEERERKIILFTSKVLKISPFGVIIFANFPYINELGLEQKAYEYNPKIQFKYDWIKYSETDEDKAVCKCKLVDGRGKDLCDWIIGECSLSSIKMETLKGYQNHMAQTRAKNRAINKVFKRRIHEDMIKEIGDLLETQQITAQEAKQIGSAVTTSAEEIQPDSKQKQKEIIVEELRSEKIKELKNMLKGKTIAEKVQNLKKRTGMVLPNFNITDKHASILIASLLVNETKH